MKPREKINWFWATGILPGTMFDDLNDREIRQLEEPRRRRTRQLRRAGLRLRKRSVSVR
jgi:hypothetical protein